MEPWIHTILRKIRRKAASLRNVPPIIGIASVAAFILLLGFTVFTVVQGQEEPQELQNPDPLGPLARDPVDPDNLPSSGPMLEPEPSDMVRFTLENVAGECVDGTLRISLRTAEAYAGSAEVIITPLSEPIPYPGGAGLQHPKAGDAQVIPLLPGSGSSVAGVTIDVDGALVDRGYHSLAVTMQGTDEDGLRHRSLPILLEAEDISCPSVP